MLTIHDLLEDSRYKEFLCRVPALPPHLSADGKLPWRLLVQLKGEKHWRTKRFATYPQAFRALKKLLPNAHDAVINCPGFAWDPPKRIVKVKGKYFTDKKGNRTQVTKMIAWAPRMPVGEFQDHHWCPYCRRPTVFARFMQHPVLTVKKLGGMGIDPTLLRCSICGVSENIVSLKRSSK